MVVSISAASRLLMMPTTAPCSQPLAAAKSQESAIAPSAASCLSSAASMSAAAIPIQLARPKARPGLGRGDLQPPRGVCPQLEARLLAIDRRVTKAWFSPLLSGLG